MDRFSHIKNFNSDEKKPRKKNYFKNENKLNNKNTNNSRFNVLNNNTEDENIFTSKNNTKKINKNIKKQKLLKHDTVENIFKNITPIEQTEKTQEIIDTNSKELFPTLVSNKNQSIKKTKNKINFKSAVYDSLNKPKEVVQEVKDVKKDFYYYIPKDITSLTEEEAIESKLINIRIGYSTQIKLNEMIPLKRDIENMLKEHFENNETKQSKLKDYIYNYFIKHGHISNPNSDYEYEYDSNSDYIYDSDEDYYDSDEDDYDIFENNNLNDKDYFNNLERDYELDNFYDL